MSVDIAGDTKDYKFGQKNQWRRTIWNAVVERTEGREKTQPILYLCGPEDHDRRVAVSKGIPNQNLIAVDRSKRNSELIRRSRRPAVTGELSEVLRAWPRERPIAACVGDFCGGLGSSEHMTRLIELLIYRAPYQSSVIVLNFQRGRDAASNDVRSLVSTDRIVPSTAWEESLARIKCQSDLSRSRLNRAYVFMIWYASLSTALVHEMYGYRSREGAAAFVSAVDASSAFFVSYRSGPLVFDSVVFKNLGTAAFTNYGVTLDDMRAPEKILTSTRDAALARRIAAMLAIRTMRARS